MSKPEKFQIIVNRLLKSNSYEMKAPEYLNFFESLTENIENTLFFIQELIKKVIELEGSKKIIKSSNLDNIVATLSILVIPNKIRQLILNCDKSKKSMILEIEKEWRSHIEKSIKYPFSTDVINNLFNLLTKGNEQAYFIKLFDQITMLPTDIKSYLKFSNQEIPSELDLGKFYKELADYYNKIESYEKGFKPENPALFTILYQEKFEITMTGETIFAYQSLVKLLNEYQSNEINLIPEQMIILIIENLKYIPFIAKKFPNKADQITMHLLHVLKQIITFYPLNCLLNTLNIQDTLKTLINIVDIYRRWAYPIGLMANELLTILFSEAKTLGSAFRYKLREDIPKIDFFYYNEQKDISKPLHIAYCLGDDFEGSFVYGILNENLLKNENRMEINAHKMRLIMIAYILNLHDKADKEFLKHLSGVDEKDAFLIYCRILNIIDKCEELDNYSDIKNIEEKALTEVCKEISKMDSEPNDKIEKFFSEYNCFVPKYPETSFKTLSGMGSKNNIDTNYSVVIEEILENIRKVELTLHQEPFKLIVFGGDQDLQSLIQDIGSIYKKKSSLLDKIDFRVYLIPNKKNTLAKYISNHDFWYCKNIYLPFMDDLIIPKLELFPDMSVSNFVSKDTCNFNLDKKVLPFDIKENLIQSYIREATKVLSLKTYEVLCYNNITNDKNAIPDKRLYFGLYLELGRNVDVEKYCLNKKINYESVYELKDKGILKFTPLDFELETYSIDFLNNISEPETIKVRISNLKLYNVYKEGFEGNMPIPNSDWLELSYIDYDNSKQEDYSIKQKNLFKKHTKEQIQNAFFSLHTSLSVYKMSIKEINNKPFDLLIDGKIYGSFTQITIQPLFSSDENKKQLSIPIMTFLPLNI